MLKAGFSRVDVTPPLGSYVSGYFHDRYAKGIIDPLYLNAVAVSDGEDTALIITADFIGIGEEIATELRKKISDTTGVKPNNIIISALHQHTAICVRRFETGSNDFIFDTGFVDVLYRKFCDVSKMAVDDMSEARLGLAEMQALEQIAFIRRFLMKDGSIVTNAKFGEGIDHPLGEPDNTVRLLRFVREGKNDIALVNFSTHPDVIGGEYFTPDWPGYTRNYVESDIEGVSCILVNGAQGDSNHLDHNLPYRNHGLEYSKHMARVIADTVLKIWDKTEVCDGIKVSGSVDFVYQQTRTDGSEFYDECAVKLSAYREGKLDKAELSFVGGPGGASRIVRMRTDPLFKKVPVSVVSLGKINFVGFGGEPFSHYATAVRDALPEKYIIAMCCANGYEGYLPTKSALLEGGYEANSSSFRPSLEEDCVNLAVQMIKNF